MDEHCLCHVINDDTCFRWQQPSYKANGGHSHAARYSCFAYGLWLFWLWLLKLFYFIIIISGDVMSSSSLNITDRSFRYHVFGINFCFIPSTASIFSNIAYYYHSIYLCSPVPSSPPSPSITATLFHSKLKTHLFHNPFHHRSSPIHWTVHRTSTMSTTPFEDWDSVYCTTVICFRFSIILFVCRMCRIKLTISQFLITR